LPLAQSKSVQKVDATKSLCFLDVWLGKPKKFAQNAETPIFGLFGCTVGRQLSFLGLTKKRCF
jgi:hypothetical protein